MPVLAGDTLRHATLDSPLGPLVVGMTGRGVAAIVFGPDARHVEDVLGAEFPDLAPARGETDGARSQLEEYFAGRRRQFDLRLDLRGTPFQLQVWNALLTVPHGTTRSYGDLAALTGRQGGARAAGQAVRRNRVPIVVPCHRIIAADGGLGGYGGRWSDAGPYASLKRQLLELERHFA